MGRTILTVDVQGGRELFQKLGKAAAAATLAAPMQKAVERIQRAMQGYPPERPGQTYHRTGNLGNSWKTQVTEANVAGSYVGTGLTGKVYENVRSETTREAYGPFVQGEQTQSRMHRGRWITDEEAIRQEAPAIEQDFADAIKHALGE